MSYPNDLYSLFHITQISYTGIHEMSKCHPLLILNSKGKFTFYSLALYVLCCLSGIICLAEAQQTNEFEVGLFGAFMILICLRWLNKDK